MKVSTSELSVLQSQSTYNRNFVNNLTTKQWLNYRPLNKTLCLRSELKPLLLKMRVAESKEGWGLDAIYFGRKSIVFVCSSHPRMNIFIYNSRGEFGRNALDRLSAARADRKTKAPNLTGICDADCKVVWDRL